MREAAFWRGNGRDRMTRLRAHELSSIVGRRHHHSFVYFASQTAAVLPRAARHSGFSVDDARLLTAARPGANLVILSGVNHVLKQAPADRASNIATYADPNLALIPPIVSFVRSH